jgi:hypothetical protein
MAVVLGPWHHDRIKIEGVDKIGQPLHQGLSIAGLGVFLDMSKICI